MSNLNELKPIISLNPFARFCCTIGNLPSSYMASLTYEEQLMWLCDYLQNTVIPAVNNNAECVKELQELYVKLKNYVDNYFNNLDVQNEINNKLDEMAKDGTLTKLIKNYIDPLYLNYEQKINDKIEHLESDFGVVKNEVASVTSGSPAGVYATISALQEADPDHSKIYVVQSDGEWYFWNNETNQWKNGGVYQGIKVPNNSIKYENLNSEINESFIPSYRPIEGNELIDNKYQGNTPTYQLSDSNAYSVIRTNVTDIKKIYVTTKFSSTSLYDITFFNSSNDRVGKGVLGPVDEIQKEYDVPENASIAVLNYNKEQGIGVKPSIDTVKYVIESTTPELYNLSNEIMQRISNKHFGNLDKGYICIVTDDGKSSAVTNTFPIVRNKNIPITFACWSESEIITNASYRQQLKDLINNYGCAVCQHGTGHFTDLTKENLVNYLRNEKQAWQNYNINVNGLCYPNHSHNIDVMAICGSMFNVCCGGGVSTNPLQYSKVLYNYETNGDRTNMFELYRISAYSKDLEYLKQCVDYAKNNNKLLIIFTHDEDVIGEQKTKLENLIDYAKQIDITFTTVNDLDKIK